MEQQTNLDRFFDVYETELTRCMADRPCDYYTASPAAAKAITAKFKAKAKESGTFGGINKDGRAFRATCKKLGIKHTYKAMDEFIKQGGVA